MIVDGVELSRQKLETLLARVDELIADLKKTNTLEDWVVFLDKYSPKKKSRVKNQTAFVMPGSKTIVV